LSTQLKLGLDIPEASAYAAFSDLHQRELWYVKEGQDVVERLPLYRELAYVDADGNEVVKVRDGEILPPESRLTIDPPPESGSELTAYFPATEVLPPGEVYVSHVVGDYVDQAAFQAPRR
jgi:hypothetical protein